MQLVISHPWNIPEDEALKLQKKLASEVVKVDSFDEIGAIAGVDVAYEKDGDKLFAAVVVLDAQSLQIIETATAADVAQFPYIPGLFSFRELPPICQALSRLKTVPDLIVCDGQGIAHPRRFGLASHLGVLFNIPTIGCGKTRLIGEATEPVNNRGGFAPLVDHDEVVGRVLRTQTGVKPVYISIGHRISIETACDWILKLSPRYRLPETTRYADQQVRQLLKDTRRL